jgi:EAL domain-containing protein (putative c-di-GMP-specific phosphodiesterase class I)
MKTKSRVTNLEQTRLNSQFGRLIESIREIPADTLNDLFNRLGNERERRGLVEKPEIEAAKSLFCHLTENQNMTNDDALRHVLEAAKASGFALTNDDVLG